MSGISGRAWLNIGLLVLVAGLALLVIYQPGLEQAKPPATLTALTPEQVNLIHIERKNRGGNITLKKDQGQWLITEPMVLPADMASVDQVLRLADTRSFRQYPVKDIDPAKLKLASPQITLRLNDVELAFGDKDALESRRYVQTGAAVHLMDDDDYYVLLAQPTQFVSKALLPPDKAPVEIKLPDLHLTRQNDNRWSMTPASLETLADAPAGLVDQWRTAQANTVQPYEEGPGKGSVIVHVEGDNDPLRFEILQSKGELILARPELGVQYVFGEDAVDRLLKLPAKKEVSTEENLSSETSAETPAIPPHHH